MSLVVCPFCGAELDMPEGLSSGCSLLCPCCAKKFLYRPESSSKSQTQNDDKSRRLRLRGLKTRVSALKCWVWARKKCIAVWVAFALAIYMCVQLTMVSVRMKELDSSVMKLRRQVGAIYSDVSSIESDVNSMESDLSHIKTWGAGR